MAMIMTKIALALPNITHSDSPPALVYSWDWLSDRWLVEQSSPHCNHALKSLWVLVGYYPIKFSPVHILILLNTPRYDYT